MNLREKCRKWLKPTIILGILGLLFCNPAFQLTWVGDSHISDYLVSAQDDVSYEVTERFAGSPSIVLPFGDYLIVAINDQLELRNSTYGLVASVQLPYFVAEAVITDGGDVIVPIPNHGLFLIEIDEEMNLIILDHYESGTWTGLECGYDFLLASPSVSADVYLFDVSQGFIVLESILTEGYSVPWFGRFPYDAEGHLLVWTDLCDFHLWNHSSGVQRVVDIPFSIVLPFFVSLEGGLLFWNGYWDFDYWFFATFIADIGNVWSNNEIVILHRYEGVHGNQVASDSEFIYMISRIESGSYPEGLWAINLTYPSDFHLIDDDYAWSTYSQTSIAADETGIVLTGLNFIMQWAFIDLDLELELTVEYPGYITDLTSAYGIFDVAVWPAYEIDQQPAERTWGYPFVNPDLFPIVGDLADINAAGNHLFYRDYKRIQSLVNPRMEHHSLPTFSWYYGIHPTAELSEYNGSLYNFIWSASYSYQLYVFDPETHYDSESEAVVGQLLHELSLSPRYYYMRTMQDDIYIAGSPSRLFAMNVTSLEYGISQASLPADSMMLQSCEDKLLVLSDVITSYEKNGSWPLSPSLIYLSELDIDADVFTVSGGQAYAANSTHVHIISLEANGSMSLVDSIEAPTNIHQRSGYFPDPEDTIFAEVGDLFVDPASGSIYRAAGTYGVWVIERTEHTEPPTTTTTTTTTTATTIEPMDFLEALVRFSTGFGISLVSVLALSLVFRRFVQHSHE